MFVYLFNEEIDLGMLPPASDRTVEAVRPHMKAVKEWSSGISRHFLKYHDFTVFTRRLRTRRYTPLPRLSEPLRAFEISLAVSFFLMDSLLSYVVFPFASPSSTFTLPPLK